MLFLPLSILLLAMLCMPLAAMELDFKASLAVNSVTFTWKDVDGASWYDLYNGQDFVARIPSGVGSHTLSHLDQETEYSFILGARDEANMTLDAEEAVFTTGSYDGTYVWTNPTDKDNGGKLKDIVYKARLRTDKEYGQYMEISVAIGGVDHVVFPIQGLHSSWDWIEWDDEGEEALAYRTNCAKFNRLSLSPSRFRTKLISLSTDKSSVDIASKALGFEVVTTSTYEFGSDEEGPYLKFTTTGSGLALSALCTNPVDKENPHTYLLRRVQ